MLVRINGWTGQISTRRAENMRRRQQVGKLWHRSCTWAACMKGGAMKRKNAKPIIISMALAVAIAITALVPASGEAEGSDAKRRPPVYQIAASDYITPFYGSPIFVKALNVEAREFGGFVG